MARKPKPKSPGYIERLRLLKQAGLGGDRPLASVINDYEKLETLDGRIKKISGIINQTKKATTMIYFILYDIEDNKVRRYIAKYLLQKGCTRIQKSVFLTSSERKEFAEISQTLKEVNEIYDNNDSILLVPVSSDELKAMRIIGQKKDVNFYLDKPNTLFF